MSKASSFYWFDYETFGTHPAWDRPCQFAGVRTDLELNEIDDPMTIYCSQSKDYLPHPAACKVTGLSPLQVNEKGLNESTFIEKIVNQIGRPGTCSLGYNSIRFDDEFTRHTLFRNFFEPYEYEYKDDNSRWDLLDIVRLTRALRPEGINWPVNEDGSPSNRLEHLSVANDIEHGHAHDALSDVRATIGMARLIRQTQPKLFAYAFDNRTKQAVSQQLRTVQPQVCLLVSGMIPASRSHITPVLPLVAHPDNRNSIIVIDLHQDPTELLGMSADDIAQRVFAKQLPNTTDAKADAASANQVPSTDSGNAGTATLRPGLRTVQINKCPVVVPLKTLRDIDAKRLGIDPNILQRHEQIARRLLEPAMLEKIITAMTRSWPNAYTDVEGTLYSGTFLSPADRQRASALRQGSPNSIVDTAAHFDDKRLIELAWRYQARNYPESMSHEQQLRWQQHCHSRLTDESAPWLSFAEFDEQLNTTQWDDEEQRKLKKELENYRRMVEEFVTSGNNAN